MDQKTIIDALQKALTGGQGTLDDLDRLLTRAKEDIAKAKVEQEEAERKAKVDYGNKVAEIATRMLNSELTDDDLAFIMNIFFTQNKLDAIWDGKTIRNMVNDCAAAQDNHKAKINQLTNDLDKLLELLLNSENDKSKSKKEVEKKQTKKDNPDAVIHDFLKSFGLE